MNKTELISKIKSLEASVNQVANENTSILETQQHLKNQLFQFLRAQEECLCGLKGEFNLQVQAMRQEFAKLNTEYHQQLSTLRASWVATFPEVAVNIPQPLPPCNPETESIS